MKIVLVEQPLALPGSANNILWNLYDNHNIAPYFGDGKYITCDSEPFSRYKRWTGIAQDFEELGLRSAVAQQVRMLLLWEWRPQAKNVLQVGNMPSMPSMS